LNYYRTGWKCEKKMTPCVAMASSSFPVNPALPELDKAGKCNSAREATELF
jgi:hypothetical protein